MWFVCAMLHINTHNVLAVLRGKYWGLSTDGYKRPDRYYDSGGYQRNSAKDDENGKNIGGGCRVNRYGV